LVLAEPGQYVTAVLGWTGSRYYERTLRDFSKKEKSININCQSVTLEDGVKKKKKIYVESEEELYSILGVPHLDPTLRNC
jgi:DNA polymerase mu